jgi:hypothetical protein
MSHLSALADALTLLGKAIDPTSVTKVLFELQHSPSDMPELGVTWTFKASLQGTKGLDDAGGNQQVSFDQAWEGSGYSDEEAIKAAYKLVLLHIQGFHTLREAEAGFAEQAVMMMAGSEDLKGLWSVEDPAKEEFEALVPSTGEGNPNGQTSSV